MSRIGITKPRPRRSGTLRPFIEASYSTGLKVDLHQEGSRVWVNPPGKPMLRSDGSVVRNEAGKVKYSPIIGFIDEQTRWRWSDRIVEAVRAQDPESLDELPL